MLGVWFDAGHARGNAPFTPATTHAAPSVSIAACASTLLDSVMPHPTPHLGVSSLSPSPPQPPQHANTLVPHPPLPAVSPRGATPCPHVLLDHHGPPGAPARGSTAATHRQHCQADAKIWSRTTLLHSVAATAAASVSCFHCFAMSHHQHLSSHLMLHATRHSTNSCPSPCR